MNIPAEYTVRTVSRHVVTQKQATQASRWIMNTEIWDALRGGLELVVLFVATGRYRVPFDLHWNASVGSVTEQAGLIFVWIREADARVTSHLFGRVWGKAGRGRDCRGLIRKRHTRPESAQPMYTVGTRMRRAESSCDVTMDQPPARG